MADFQQHQADLEQLNARVVALSSDPEPDAAATVTELGLRFPVGYGLDAETAVRAIGCYAGSHEGCRHLQPTAFLLNPDGTVRHAVYSSAKVGRLTAGDTLTLLRNRQKTEAKEAHRVTA